jgi:hypothetical protein
LNVATTGAWSLVPISRLRRTRDRARGQRFARQHVVQPPADVALLHVPPRGPPAEVLIVVRIEHAPDVDEPSFAEQSLEQFPLLGELSDRARLALLRMHVHVAAGDVHVAAQHEIQAARAQPGRISDQRVEERDLRVEVLPAVRNVHAGEHCVLDLSLDDARLVIELGMPARDVVRETGADVQADARVSPRPVPVARISFNRTALRDLIELRLDLLQADHIGLFRRHPLRKLLVARANPVHVPGGNLHGPGIVSSGTINLEVTCANTRSSSSFC